MTPEPYAPKDGPVGMLRGIQIGCMHNLDSARRYRATKAKQGLPSAHSAPYIHDVAKAENDRRSRPIETNDIEGRDHRRMNQSWRRDTEDRLEHDRALNLRLVYACVE